MFKNNYFFNFKNNLVALNDSGEKLTYGELNELINKLKIIINERCLVFCFCSNTLGSLVGYTSFISNRIVPLLLDSSLDLNFINNLFNIYKPSFVWLPSKDVHKFGHFQNILEINEYVLLKTNFQYSYPLFDQLALLLTTSGSTGSPKLVRLSYENLESNTLSIIQYLGIDDSERPITILPMNYSYGLSIINTHLYKGATILFTEKSILEKEFWSFLKAERATSISGVPYTFEILQKLNFSNMKLPSLKTLTQAGGKLNLDTIKYFTQYSQNENKSFYLMYGQTEASPRISYLPPLCIEKKIGSIGIPIPGGELYLISETNTKIDKVGESGELVYKGKNVALGYSIIGDNLSLGDINNGILYTGDIAYFDNDNYFYITGRKNRDVKVFGNRINLDHIEELFKSIIGECACIGKENKILIFIIDQKKELELQDFILNKLFFNKNTFCIKILSEIPKNTFGKIIYTNLELN